MAEFLALEWEHEQVCGVSAQVSGGRVRVRRCFVLPKPTTAVSGSGTQPVPVAWLRSQLSGLGVSGGPVLVSLPRDEAVVKRVELPETPDDELPLIVRYQAGAKSSVSLEEMCLDFIPLPRRSEVPGREVVMATVPRQMLEEVRVLCEATGLELRSLGITPAAVSELVARAEPAGRDDAASESLVVARHGKRLEISVFRRAHLLFSHSARLSDEGSGQEPQAIVAEVSRALVALRGAISEVKIGRAWTLVAPAEHDPLAETLRKRLSCDVERLDPFAGVDCDKGALPAGLDPGLFAGPLGMLLAQAEARAPSIDLLNPRQPPVKRDLRKRRMKAFAVAGGILAALLLGNYWMTVSGLSGEIADLESTRSELTETVNSGKDVMQSAKSLDDWEAGNVAWLDQMAELTRRMPSTDQAFLSKLALESKLGAAPSKVKPSGVARDQKVVLELGDKFTEDGKYRPQPTKASPGSGENFYSWKFDADIEIVDLPKKKGAKAAGAPAKSNAKEPARPDAKDTTKPPGESAPQAPPAEAPAKAAAQGDAPAAKGAAS